MDNAMPYKHVKSFKGKKAFLSNFYKCDIFYDGWIYPSVEHAFQASKTMDIYDREIIRMTKSPAKAKQIGRSLYRIRNDWEIVKYGIMHQLLWYKFTHNVDLLKRLVDTEKEELIEINDWHDNYWGKCVCKDCISGTIAKNRLGMLLMEIRGSELLQSY